MSTRWRAAVVFILLSRDVVSFLKSSVVYRGSRFHSNGSSVLSVVSDGASVYADYWRSLLVAEQQEAVAELRTRRASWSQKRLEEGGISVFDASAEPESDLYGEKIVRIFKQGETRFRDRFARGDVLLMTTLSFTKNQAIPKECCIVDVGKDWMTLAVGPSWPPGLWEARRLPGSFTVRLDRTAPQAPLIAQQMALELTRKGEAGEAASMLVRTFGSDEAEVIEKTSERPSRLKNYTGIELHEAITRAISEAKDATSFDPNKSQEDAIAWALGRRVSLLIGPPGTGKTRVAALLISTALRLRGVDSKATPRVLAVAHSNGAADVLLEALLQIGIPAVRAGRPASVSPEVRHRTVIAMADTHPEVVSLRQQSRDLTLESHVRSHITTEMKNCICDVCQTMLQTAPVVVASCVGAHQLLDESDMPFPLVVVDEAAQTTEPALLCALAAAKAEQVVFVGDTRQLPPTVASEDPQIREKLGISPMARLESIGIGQQTLQVQYRMSPALLEHPSQYFYNGLVSCATEIPRDTPPLGFPWPRTDAPLAFVQVGSNLEVSHEFGGKSNPTEASLVADIVLSILEGGDVEARGVAVISPYSKQVQRIRNELATRNVRDVRVGTVDSFQGQETELVVFSAVRSNSDNELGFLRDPRRLCVAITRARRGLIIIGDIKVLRSSRHWAALIDSCQKRGCYLDSEEFRRDPIHPGQDDGARNTVTAIEAKMRSSDAGSEAEIDELLSALLGSDDELFGLFDNT